MEKTNPLDKLVQKKQQIQEGEVKALQEKLQKEQEEKSARSEYKESVFNKRRLLEDQKDELQKHHKEIKDKMEEKILLLREARSTISDTPALEAEFRSEEGFKNYTKDERVDWDNLAEENRNISIEIKNIDQEIKTVEDELKKIELEDTIKDFKNKYPNYESEITTVESNKKQQEFIQRDIDYINNKLEVLKTKPVLMQELIDGVFKEKPYYIYDHKIIFQNGRFEDMDLNREIKNAKKELDEFLIKITNDRKERDNAVDNMKKGFFQSQSSFNEEKQRVKDTNEKIRDENNEHYNFLLQKHEDLESLFEIISCTSGGYIEFDRGQDYSNPNRRQYKGAMKVSRDYKDIFGEVIRGPREKIKDILLNKQSSQEFTIALLLEKVIESFKEEKKKFENTDDQSQMLDAYKEVFQK
jgi:hypothetical protein